MLLHQRLRVRSVLAHQRPAGDRRDDRVAAVAQVGVVVRLATARVSVRVGVRCGCSFSEVLCAPSVSVDGWHDHKAGRVAGRLAPGSGAARARPLYRACPSQRARRRQRGGSSIHAPTVSLALYTLHARAWRPIAGAIARRPARKAHLRPCGHRRGAGVYLRFSSERLQTPAFLW